MFFMTNDTMVGMPRHGIRGICMHAGGGVRTRAPRAGRAFRQGPALRGALWAAATHMAEEAPWDPLALSAFVLFDTEYTAWEGSHERDWSGEGEHREIIQVSPSRLPNSSKLAYRLPSPPASSLPEFGVRGPNHAGALCNSDPAVEHIAHVCELNAAANTAYAPAGRACLPRDAGHGLDTAAAARWRAAGK